MKKTKIFIGALAATALLASIASCKKNEPITSTPIISSSTEVGSTSNSTPSIGTTTPTPSTSTNIGQTTPNVSTTPSGPSPSVSTNPSVPTTPVGPTTTPTPSVSTTPVAPTPTITPTPNTSTSTSSSASNNNGQDPQKTYNVIFNNCGHGEELSSLISVYALPETLPELTAENWTFEGWYYDATYTKKAAPLDAIENNIVLFAKWTYNTPSADTEKKITFNLQEFITAVGTNSTTDSDNKTKTTADIEYNQFKICKGVRIDSGFNTQGKDIYFTANGVSNTFTISGTGASSSKKLQLSLYALDANGNVIDTIIATSQSVGNGESLTFIVENLAAGTYYLKNVTTAAMKVSAMEIVEKNAQPSKEIYNVIFNTNNGSTLPTIQVEEGNLVSKPTNPTKTGYKFIGWYTDSALTKEFDFTTTITSDITLYAKWQYDEENPVTEYTVTFVYDNGTQNTETKVVENNKISKPLNPTKEGYIFKGWYNGNVAYDFNTPVTSDLTLTAIWELEQPKQTYTVSFELNGYGEAIDSLNVSSLPASLPQPTSQNFNFDGWYYDALFTKKANALDSIEKNTTLYAKWSPKSAEADEKKITFNLQEFKTAVGTNSTTDSDNKTKTTADIEYSQFKICKGVRIDSGFNTQGKDIYFTANGTTNTFTIKGTCGSSSKKLQLSLYALDANENVIDTIIATSESVGNGESLTFVVENLAAGTYYLKNVTAAAMKVTTMEIVESNAEPAKQIYNVVFNTNNGSSISARQVVEGDKLDEQTISTTKTGYKFIGWYTDSTLTKEFDFETPITSDITLYAKWEFEINDDETFFTVTFITNCDASLDPIRVIEGNKVSLPEDPIYAGHYLAGWFTDKECTKEFLFSTPITSDITLYALWEVEEYKVTFSNCDLGYITVKYGEYVTKPQDPTKSGYIFKGWYTDNSCTKEFDFNSSPITGNTIIYAFFKKDNSSSDITDKDQGSGTVEDQGDIMIVEAGASMESAYMVFNKLNSSAAYDFYLSNSDGSYDKVDTDIAYSYEISSTQMRVDFLGLSAGTYSAMVLPSGSSTAKGSVAKFNVIAYDRSGYAHFNYTSGVGAYNDNGTLKDNAIVLYVTDKNKNTIELSYKGKTVKGIGNILNSVGADTGSGTCANGGTPNTNQGILKLLAQDDIPLVVRFVGCVSNTGLYQKGTFDASKTPLIDGLTIYNSTGNGGTKGDNGHMARMKSAKDVTIEGIGTDATIDGWGFHFMCESSSPDLGKSFEVRNLTFINTPEDAIGMEGVQVSANASSVLSASVERCWIHNNEFYGPTISNPAESDKSEGDGSCDFKRGQYFTCSYNYFEGCHKTNLVGSADSSLQYNLTYHHNYWKLCKARGPLARRANIHMYNNVFEGQTDYAINTRAEAYVFSEYNMFYMCKNPFRVDGGAIKSYNDSVSSALYQKGKPTIVTDKTQKVSNNCKFIGEGIDYSEFDTDSNLSYIADGDYDLQTNVTDARRVIAAYGGVRKDSSKSPSDITLKELALETMKNSSMETISSATELAPGKLSKKMYGFKLEMAATVTITYADNSEGKSGVLVNQAGECLMTASGTIQLNPGVYYIQCENFQPGDAGSVTVGTFKDVTINSIKFEKYNSDELNQKLIEQYNSAVSQIPSNIEYNSICQNAIKKAMSTYNNLSAELKQKVDYSKVETAYNTYISLGKSYVEELIDSIGTVDSNSGLAITTARKAYGELSTFAGGISISNYSKLVEAEDSFAQYAVQYVIDVINSIGEVSLEKENLLYSARNAYESLEEDDKSKVTNYQTLVQAEAKFTNLEKAAQFDELINDVDMSSTSSMKEVIEAYNKLTSEQASLITTFSQLSNVKVSLTIKLIDSIGTVSKTSANLIVEAETLYTNLSTNEKALVTNYDTLVQARKDYDEIASQMIIKTFDEGVTDSSGYFTISGNLKSGVASKTYNGVTYTTALKLESATSIKFTCTGNIKLTIITDAASKKIKIDGSNYSTDSNGVLIMELSSGEHTITKGETLNCYAIIVE